MGTHKFLTVMGELLDTARAMAEHFETHGHKVQAEPREVMYPLTPTLRATRGQSTRIIEVGDKINTVNVKKWIAYCKSCGKDTRFAICVPSMDELDPKKLKLLQSEGVGLFEVTADNVNEIFSPKDLAMKVELPSLKGLKKGVRISLGPAWEDFRNKGWDEGFENACKALEKDARKYLARWNGQRINILSQSGQVRSLSASQIEKMPMGALAQAYARINTPDARDNKIGQVLAMVNEDRIKIAHKKKRWESIRSRVGNHMYAILNAVKEIHDGM